MRARGQGRRALKLGPVHVERTVRTDGVRLGRHLSWQKMCKAGWSCNHLMSQDASQTLVISDSSASRELDSQSGAKTRQRIQRNKSRSVDVAHVSLWRCSSVFWEARSGRRTEEGSWARSLGTIPEAQGDKWDQNAKSAALIIGARSEPACCFAIVFSLSPGKHGSLRPCGCKAHDFLACLCLSVCLGIAYQNFELLAPSVGTCKSCLLHVLMSVRLSSGWKKLKRGKLHKGPTERACGVHRDDGTTAEQYPMIFRWHLYCTIYC